MWPSNKDIPLFIRVPVIMNHRVYIVREIIAGKRRWADDQTTTRATWWRARDSLSVTSCSSMSLRMRHWWTRVMRQSEGCLSCRAQDGAFVSGEALCRGGGISDSTFQINLRNNRLQQFWLPDLSSGRGEQRSKIQSIPNFYPKCQLSKDRSHPNSSSLYMLPVFVNPIRWGTHSEPCIIRSNRIIFREAILEAIKPTSTWTTECMAEAFRLGLY